MNDDIFKIFNSIIEDIKKYIDNLNQKNFIFRGTNQKFGKEEESYYNRVNSTLYRDLEENKVNTRTTDFQEEQDRIVKKAKDQLKISALDNEILTEMRHFGGKTNLIDFTKNLHIALFFACYDNSYHTLSDDGELFVLDKSGLSEENKIDIIEPIYNQNSAGRAKIQHSVFVNPKRGYLVVSDSPPILKSITIEADNKKKILNYLDLWYDINEHTIFNDLIGFISNKNNYKTPEILVKKGIEFLK